MFRRDRGPYAAQAGRPVVIDWAAEQQASAAARAQAARVEEEVRQNRFEEMLEADPIHQLMKRCHATEQRVQALEELAGRLTEQVQTITKEKQRA